MDQAKEKLFTAAKERYPENKEIYDSDPENLGPRGWPYVRSLHEGQDLLRNDDSVRDLNPSDLEKEFQEWLT